MCDGTRSIETEGNLTPSPPGRPVSPDQFRKSARIARLWRRFGVRSRLSPSQCCRTSPEFRVVSLAAATSVPLTPTTTNSLRPIPCCREFWDVTRRHSPGLAAFCLNVRGFPAKSGDMESRRQGNSEPPSREFGGSKQGIRVHARTHPDHASDDGSLSA